jgi:hypothetical protein
MSKQGGHVFHLQECVVISNTLKGDHRPFSILLIAREHALSFHACQFHQLAHRGLLAIHQYTEAEITVQKKMATIMSTLLRAIFHNEITGAFCSVCSTFVL